MLDPLASSLTCSRLLITEEGSTILLLLDFLCLVCVCVTSFPYTHILNLSSIIYRTYVLNHHCILSLSFTTFKYFLKITFFYCMHSAVCVCAVCDNVIIFSYCIYPSFFPPNFYACVCVCVQVELFFLYRGLKIH